MQLVMSWCSEHRGPDSVEVEEKNGNGITHNNHYYLHP